MNGRESRDHWLARPENVKWLWRGFWIVLALTVAVQALVPVKGHFRLDGWFGFGAVFGFLSCLAMVLVAKALGFLLKRREDFYIEGGYYDDDGGPDA